VQLGDGRTVDRDLQHLSLSRESGYKEAQISLATAPKVARFNRLY
jgi:hypothetical protein